ncbi:reverse transcriptase domain-containing protein [Tanacetum coccineum]
MKDRYETKDGKSIPEDDGETQKPETGVEGFGDGWLFGYVFGSREARRSGKISYSRCALQELNRTSALADSGASINLLPHSIYKKLGLEALTPTRMTLELAIVVHYLTDGHSL